MSELSVLLGLLHERLTSLEGRSPSWDGAQLRADAAAALARMRGAPADPDLMLVILGRLEALEREVRELRALIQSAPPAPPTGTPPAIPAADMLVPKRRETRTAEDRREYQREYGRRRRAAARMVDGGS